MNIVFDLAGVVVRYDQAALITKIFPDPTMHVTVRADIIGHGDWLALDRGTLSQLDAIVRAAHRTGLSATDIAQFFAQMSAAWVPIAGTVALLQRLHTQGHPLFCLSNMHVASIAYLEQTYTFWDVFTGVVISCRVQLIKPEPAIYAYLLAQYGLAASQTIGLVTTLALTLLLVPLASDAQLAPKVHRIGWLVAGSGPSGSEPRLETFRRGIRDLGYVEGQNLLIEYRSAEGSDARLRDLAAELVRLPVEVIVVGGSASTRAAQQATRTIPIVMASSGDPVGRGFVASLAHPGGNITGLSNFVAELPAKQLELLTQAVPQGARIAVLTNPAVPSHGAEMETLAVAAKALGVHVHVVPLRSSDEVAGAFAALTREGAEALVVLGEPLLLDHIIGAIVDLAAQHRLPAIYCWRRHVEAGGLMSYGPNQPAYWRRIAYYVDRILQGAKPADLPVEQPMTFELVINLKSAKALGITFPPTFLMQADEVIR